MANKKLIVDGTSLTLDKIENFILQNLQVEISSKAKSKIKKSRALIEKWVENNEVIYGVTTGFGEFSNVNISKKDIIRLQENLILSHCGWLRRKSSSNDCKNNDAAAIECFGSRLFRNKTGNSSIAR